MDNHLVSHLDSRHRYLLVNPRDSRQQYLQPSRVDNHPRSHQHSQLHNHHQIRAINQVAFQQDNHHLNLRMYLLINLLVGLPPDRPINLQLHHLTQRMYQQSSIQLFFLPRIQLSDRRLLLCCLLRCRLLSLRASPQSLLCLQ